MELKATRERRLGVSVRAILTSSHAYLFDIRKDAEHIIE
jgi:hypothetical protein